jgi:hypothetical protein
LRGRKCAQPGLLSYLNFTSKSKENLSLRRQSQELFVLKVPC